MSERVQAYFKELEKRSSEDLDRSAVAIASREKKNVARQIAHIAEIGRRKYHVKLGYTSLFEYCVKRLHLGEGTVRRRTHVAGICRLFPQILESLYAGRLHLTGASVIAPALTEENAQDLITAAEGKTKREIEEILVTFAPREPFKPSVRRQSPSDPSPRDCRRIGDDPALMAQPGASAAAPEENPSPSLAGASRTRDVCQPATEDRYNFRFSAGKVFTENVKRLAEVLNVPSPHKHLEEILGEALEIALDKKDPQRKLQRRQQRKAKKAAKANGVEQHHKPKAQATKEPSGNAAVVSRYLPSEVRERVLARSGYRCEYRSPTGERCTCRTGLQVDHVLPFGVYHSHAEGQLRALCPAHNLYVAGEYYGRTFITGKIRARRQEKARQSEPREEELAAPQTSFLA